MKKFIAPLLVFIIVAVGVIALVIKNKDQKNQAGNSANNVSILDGRQIITINAKGGYDPKTTIAKAGLPTVLKIVTKGTYDCSTALTIPSINYKTSLPTTGVTNIEIPAQEANANIRGVCTMGMYSFKIDFQN